ncbi:Ser/Thr protein kinase RdoA (MazF antagonist) [Paenibacillus phyllosphaerae]|uniref:Ser/Thr protein kinase RdoA (MazF antagonist) n=1 Tax=Paenibacillus phyllosphaerae TaxID=274593 RepID=A0A7W5B311_9BACL|nr:phosphotransferase [Paenibacillus phyllosphaerae]MBB3112746.1 Ser/Thr protein kinase RdoA (MazF antagonist) [Paenibacillus phyllosphaerae]
MYTQPAALRSVLDPKYLAYCLSGQYGIGPWQECLYWLRGLNDTYRVRTAEGFYILRIYRLAVRENDVAYELSLLTQLSVILRECGMETTVSAPIPRRDGGLYAVIDAPEGQRVAALFRYMDGAENVLQDEENCLLFGKSAAELHNALDRVNLRLPRYELNTDFLIRQPLERIVDYIGGDNAASSFLREYAGALTEQVAAAANQGLDFGICHGDMHGNNNAFRTESSFTHHDFEWAARGWRAYDLAQVRARKRQAEDRKEALWQTLMSGYRSVRSFSEHEEAAIELFVAVRRFWIMSLDVAFIHSDSGALDFTQDWLDSFVEEFKGTGILR